jgi:hypothetical protein
MHPCSTKGSPRCAFLAHLYLFDIIHVTTPFSCCVANVKFKKLLKMRRLLVQTCRPARFSVRRLAAFNTMRITDPVLFERHATKTSGHEQQQR